MDVDRITRLLAEGKVTGEQVARAAAMGLVPMDAVPEESRATADALVQLRKDAGNALVVNRQLGSQNQAIIDFCKAVVGSVTEDIKPVDPADPNLAFALIDHGTKVATALAGLTNAVKLLAAGVQTLAEHDAALLEQNIGILQLIVGTPDSL